jgi:TetR/AcrR family transcriptional repressor of nem operon
MSKAEKTKNFIIAKTAPLFNKRGFSGTSLSDITNITGLTKGSIYGNFSDKDEVALAAFDYNLHCVSELIKKEMESRKTNKEKLLVYVDVYGHYSKSDFPEGGCPVLNTATEADDTHPALKQKASEAISAWKHSIVRLIEKGIREKEFASDTDPNTVALTLIALLEGSILISRLTGKPAYKKTLMQAIYSYIDGFVLKKN